MWRIYSCLAYEHDLRFVVLAVAVCVLGSFTGITALQRVLAAEERRRRHWLIIAGCVTGISIWTTHFTAMLGYAWELDLQTNIEVDLTGWLWTGLIERD